MIFDIWINGAYKAEVELFFYIIGIFRATLHSATTIQW